MEQVATLGAVTRRKAKAMALVDNAVSVPTPAVSTRIVRKKLNIDDVTVEKSAPEIELKQGEQLAGGGASSSGRLSSLVALLVLVLSLAATRFMFGSSAVDSKHVQAGADAVHAPAEQAILSALSAAVEEQGAPVPAAAQYNDSQRVNATVFHVTVHTIPSIHGVVDSSTSSDHTQHLAAELPPVTAVPAVAVDDAVAAPAPAPAQHTDSVVQPAPAAAELVVAQQPLDQTPPQASVVPEPQQAQMDAQAAATTSSSGWTVASSNSMLSVRITAEEGVATVYVTATKDLRLNAKHSRLCLALHPEAVAPSPSVIPRHKGGATATATATATSVDQLHACLSPDATSEYLRSSQAGSSFSIVGLPSELQSSPQGSDHRVPDAGHVWYTFTLTVMDNRGRMQRLIARGEGPVVPAGSLLVQSAAW